MSRQVRATSAPIPGDDIPAVLIEAIVLTVTGLARALWWVLVQLLRMPALALLLLLGVVVWLRFGMVAFGLSVSATCMGLVGWRFGAPISFRRLVWLPLVTLARAAEHRTRWPRVARRSGLVVHEWTTDRSMKQEVVRLLRVQVTPSGVERLHLRLPVGLAPADVAAKTEAIAHALKCRDARLVADRPGRVCLELRRTDTLAAVVTLVSVSGPLDLAAIPVGRCEDGSTWLIRLAGTHLLVAGATGSGKSSVLWSMLRALGLGIRERTVEVWAVDPKGGMELRPGRALFARFEDASPEDMCAMLEDLVVVKDERARSLAAAGERVHAPRPGSPHIVALLDELATLTAFADRATTRRIDLALGLLLTQGRACGISVVAAVQDPGKDIVGWRDLFPTRIALRLDNPIQVAMVLGEGARELGAKADEISELTPGVAYVRVEGTRAIKRVRAGYLTDADISELAQSARPFSPEADPHPATGGPRHVVTGGDFT